MNIRRLLGAGVIWLGMSVPAIASLVIKMWKSHLFRLYISRIVVYSSEFG